MKFFERLLPNKQGQATEQGQNNANKPEETEKKQPFPVGKKLKVFRNSDELEGGWKVTGYKTVEGVEAAVMQKQAKEGLLEKNIPIQELVDANTEGKADEFGTAKDFKELLTLLDQKGDLWGSQKKYRAEELKMLINRVRTQNPDLHLPLETIPETGGLRQKVSDLLEIESMQKKLKKAA